MAIFSNLTFLWCLLIACGVVGVYALVMINNGHKYSGSATSGNMTARWILLLAAVAIAIASAVQISALSATPIVDDDPPPVVDEDPQPKEELFPAITLTDLELQQMFGHYSRVFDESSMPIKAQERIAATKALMLAVGYKEDQVFQDGVVFPVLTEDQIKVLSDPKATVEEKQAIFDEVRDKVYQMILANPVYGDMFAQGLCEISYITDSNPWLLEFRKELDSSLNPATGRGWLNWLTATNAAKTEFMTSDEYFSGAARICAVLEYFDFQQLTTKESAGNWSLKPAAEADFVRTSKAETEESAEAIMLVHRQKSGDDKVQLGVNVFDGRLEIFDVSKPTPATEVKKEDPPKTEDKPKGDPPKTEKFTLTIHYVFSGGGEAAPDYVTTQKKGWAYDRESPAIEGYTPDKARVTGTLNGNTTETVTYSKNTPSQVTLTVNYRYQNGSKAAESFIGSYDKGAWYSVKSPIITGHEPDFETVSGTISDNLTLTVTYKPVQYTVTIHYVYAETGKKAAADWVDKGYVAGQEFRRESPVIQGYKPDVEVVRGTVRDKNVEVTVTYYAETGRLTIFYEYKDGSTAAATYRADVKVGAKYSVKSPSISGYTPTMSIVQGTMTAEGRTATVVYTQDGQGKKDPSASSMNQGNAQENGGINNPQDPDRTGSYQPTNPPQHDYGTGGNNNGGNNGTTSNNPNVTDNGDGTVSAPVPGGSKGDNETVTKTPDQQQPAAGYTDPGNGQTGNTVSDPTNTGTITKPK